DEAQMVAQDVEQRRVAVSGDADDVAVDGEAGRRHRAQAWLACHQVLRRTRPGSAPVCFLSSSSTWPLTIVCETPSEVSLIRQPPAGKSCTTSSLPHLTVVGSKIAMSAAIPGRSNPRS